MPRKNPKSITDWATSNTGFIIADAKKQKGRLMPGPVQLMSHQKKILRHIFKKDRSGRFPYDVVVWSCPKKSGKTMMGALVGEWFALTQEAPNEIYVIANDLEQAQSRVFDKIRYSIQKNPSLKSVRLTNREIRFEKTGTRVIALSNDYASAAGSNHGLTLWDELWAYTSTAMQRLWDELTPVPTRLNSMRFITTYAGCEGQSATLFDLYRKGVGEEEFSEGMGERVPELGDIPCYKNGRLFVYWDHELRKHPGLSITSQDYHEQQKLQLRPAAYLRLHENRWTSDEEMFIPPERWDGCVDQNHTPMLADEGKSLWIHVDASVKRDSSAAVATYYDRETRKVVLAMHRIWQPTPDAPLDLEETIEKYLIELWARYRVSGISYDPYQFHRSATTLAKRGIPVVEFPQTEPNLTAASQQLYELLEYKNLVMYPSNELRKQAMNAVALEKKRGWRIAKEKTSSKIDSVVSLAASAYHTITNGAYIIDKPLTLTSNFSDDGGVPAAWNEESLPAMFRN